MVKSSASLADLQVDPDSRARTQRSLRDPVIAGHARDDEEQRQNGSAGDLDLPHDGGRREPPCNRPRKRLQAEESPRPARHLPTIA